RRGPAGEQGHHARPAAPLTSVAGRARRRAMSREGRIPDEGLANRRCEPGTEGASRPIDPRRRWRAVPIACMVLLALGRAAGAQQPGIQVSDEGVRLDFQDADLRVVIAALAELGGLTVV